MIAVVQTSISESGEVEVLPLSQPKSVSRNAWTLPKLQSL